MLTDPIGAASEPYVITKLQHKIVRNLQLQAGKVALHRLKKRDANYFVRAR